MVKAKLHKATVARAAGAVGQPTKQALSPSIQVAVSEEIALHTEHHVATDYLDMQDIPEENGLPNAGYLVLRKGELIRILYLGSEATGDEGWLYGEVKESIAPAIAGRRGWLPSHVLRPQSPAAIEVKKPPIETVVHAKSGAGSGASSRTTDHGPGPPVQESGYVKVVSSQPKPSQTRPRQPQSQPVALRHAAEDNAALPPAATLASALEVARIGNGKQRAKRKGRQSPNQSQSPTSEAFPALPGHSGTAWWDEQGEEDEAEEEPVSRPAAVEEPRSQRDVETTIARHRAAAAEAVAKARAKEKPGQSKGGKKKVDEACPICMEQYSGQRRRAKLPCCGGEMCAQCSEKSLRSKRCFLCREEADDFPSLHASAGC